jgi:hypothetical protein
MAAVLVLFAVILLMKVVGLIALSLVDRPPTPQPRHPDPCLAPLLDLPLPPAPDPEKALLGNLRAGKISRESYRTAMAALAAEEAEVNPLRTPAAPDS